MPRRVVNNAWGSLTFTFTDCTHGKVDFVSTLGYGAGSMNLTRLTQPAGLTCPSNLDIRPETPVAARGSCEMPIRRR